MRHPSLFVVASVPNDVLVVASVPNDVLVVASVDQTLARSSFTNHGASVVDIAAPGEDWTLAIPGSGTPTRTTCGTGGEPCDGTSFATPMVSGTAALLLALDATLASNPVGLRNAILTGAPDGQSGAPVLDGNLLDLDTALANLGY